MQFIWMKKEKYLTLNWEKDLENKIIKFIGDPEKRIQEDFLRIIRFIRFSVQYNYQKLSHQHLKQLS